MDNTQSLHRFISGQTLKDVHKKNITTCNLILYFISFAVLESIEGAESPGVMERWMVTRFQGIKTILKTDISVYQLCYPSL